MSRFVMMLEGRQRMQIETQKRETLNGHSPSKLSKNIHLKACKPKNIIFVRTGHNLYMDYTNIVDSVVRKRLITASIIDGIVIKNETGNSKRHGHQMKLKYGNRTDNLDAVYLDWAHKLLTNHDALKTNHYGSGYKSLNRIATRFLGNMLCLETHQDDSFRKNE